VSKTRELAVTSLITLDRRDRTALESDALSLWPSVCSLIQWAQRSAFS
jgi:hypothetical protein